MQRSNKGGFTVKKIIGLLLVLSVFCTLGINVFAQDTVGGKITLTQFLGVDEENAKTVTLSYGGNTYTVDKAKFFDLADSIILTSTLDPQETDMDGIYITAQTSSGEYCYAYLSEAGGADKYSLAMSRLPYAMYIADNKEELNGLYSIAGISSKKVSDWAKDTVAEFESTYGLSESDFGTSDYTQNITREIFCNMADYTLRQNGYDTGHYDQNPFGDVSSPTVSRLYYSGIINGKSEKTFAPNDYITREEAAAILYRMAEFMKKDIPNAAGSSYYNDEEKISDWAVDAVSAMHDMGIMEGVSDNEFSPKTTYTIEQSIATMMRLYE